MPSRALRGTRSAVSLHDKLHVRRRRRAPAAPEDEVRVIGARKPPFRDFYHAFLRAPWPVALAAIVAPTSRSTPASRSRTPLGGVAGARPRSFADAFYFSVQTMGTIGYGAMYPRTRAANLLVVIESVTGLARHGASRPASSSPSSR